MEYGERQQKRRFVVLTAIFAGSLGILTLYLFWLQIVRGGEYTQRARTVSERESPLTAQRGEIFDRHADDPLVFNVDSFAVDVVPGDVPASQMQGLFTRLAGVLSIGVDEVSQKIKPRDYKTFQPVEIASGVTLSTIDVLAENMDQFPGVSWHNKPIRSYVEGDTLAHVIGYVGDISSDELQMLYNRGYTAGTTIGKAGVERQYDSILRGKDGKRFKLVDVQEKSITGAEDTVEPPTPGSNVVLTIDRDIQKLASQALGKRNGSVVVLKPSTGEILAMVSYPSFDPNRFFGADSSQYFTSVALDPSSPFLDRAIQSSYPPGSTFKVIMTTAVVDDGRVNPDRQFQCLGSFTLGDRTSYCWQKTGHGWENLFSGLADSCDVYFWNVGYLLGPTTILNYAQQFGVGQKTGIDLPGEAEGLLPTPEWRDKVKHKQWVGGDTLNISIGQGDVQMTPLQLADMMAMVVNSGVIYKPHVLLETQDPQSGTVLSKPAPEKLLTSAISAANWQTVREALRGVITKGTAAPVITTKAVQIAGKTGTAQIVAGVETKRWHSWFVAYGPYDAPNPDDQVVVAVMVEASNNWEWWAPKAADLIFQGIYAHQTFEQAVATLHPWYMPAGGVPAPATGGID